MFSLFTERKTGLPIMSEGVKYKVPKLTENSAHSISVRHTWIREYEYDAVELMFMDPCIVI
jgi:hypothetical protein